MLVCPLIDHGPLFRLMQVHALCPGMRASDAVPLSRWRSEREVHAAITNRWKDRGDASVRAKAGRLQRRGPMVRAGFSKESKIRAFPLTSPPLVWWLDSFDRGQAQGKLTESTSHVGSLPSPSRFYVLILLCRHTTSNNRPLSSCSPSYVDKSPSFAPPSFLPFPSTTAWLGFLHQEHHHWASASIPYPSLATILKQRSRPLLASHLLGFAAQIRQTI